MSAPPRGDRRRKEPVAAATEARVAAETAALEASETKETEERDPDGGSTLTNLSGGDDDHN